MGGRLAHRRQRGASLADIGVCIGEIEIQRCEKSLCAAVQHCLRMLHGEGIPVQRLRRRRLVPRHEVRRDRCIVVITSRRPRILE